MSTEIWKPIAGYEGLYEVSNYGRVKSFTKWSKKKERILKPTWSKKNKKGYLKVMLQKDKERKNIRVHRLVLQAFGTVPLTPELEGNHKDLNRANNHIDNLELITGLENIEHYLSNYDPEYHKIISNAYRNS